MFLKKGNALVTRHACKKNDSAIAEAFRREMLDPGGGKRRTCFASEAHADGDGEKNAHGSFSRKRQKKGAR